MTSANRKCIKRVAELASDGSLISALGSIQSGEQGVQSAARAKRPPRKGPNARYEYTSAAVPLSSERRSIWHAVRVHLVLREAIVAAEDERSDSIAVRQIPRDACLVILKGDRRSNESGTAADIRS